MKKKETDAKFFFNLKAYSCKTPVTVPSVFHHASPSEVGSSCVQFLTALW